jgi:hypothetical protein
VAKPGSHPGAKAAICAHNKRQSSSKKPHILVSLRTFPSFLLPRYAALCS